MEFIITILCGAFLFIINGLRDRIKSLETDVKKLIEHHNDHCKICKGGEDGKK